MSSQGGFFDVDDRLSRSSALGDRLEGSAAAVDFEIFRAELEKSLNSSSGALGGRPPYDAVLVFKILIVQTQNSLSDKRTELLINDRLSFMRFLGLGLGDRVPDARTIWAFRERLTQAGAIERLFGRFDQALREAGYVAMSDQIVDATLVAAPKQRNSDEEKRRIKAGESAQRIWPDKPAKARHKDVSARWTLIFDKGRIREGGTRSPDIAIPLFGYKAHVSIDRRWRFIRRWVLTSGTPSGSPRHVAILMGTRSAAAHEGRMLRRGLIDRSNTAAGVWADSAYRSAKNEAFLQSCGMLSHIHPNKPQGEPMAACIRTGNATSSRRRAPIEHVFAFQKNVAGLFVRTVGLARAQLKIGLANILHDVNRLAWIRKAERQ